MKYGLRIRIVFRLSESLSFAKLNNKESTWTPPEGKFTAIDHYVDRCRRAVNALDFKTRTRQNNLTPSEKQALLHFNKRDDIVIKPTDKGGAVVIWSRSLYDAEAHKQLSDGRFTNAFTTTLLRNTSK